MKNNKTLIGKIKGFPQLSICVGYIVMFVLLTVMSKDFLTAKNLLNVLRQTSSTMIVAVGMTLVLITGGIDLSVGSVAALSATMSVAFMVNYQLPVGVSLLLGLLIGAACGFINGLVISKLQLPAFIVTLAMMSSARGLALVYTNGKTIVGVPDSAIKFGQGYVLSVIPIPVIVMVVILIIAGIFITKTVFSRYIYAVGGNEECAKLSGINVNKVKIVVYSLSGLSAAIAGIILTMRLASGQPTLGEGLEMDAIAACVLGGTSLSGGKGFLFGTIIGSIFLTTLSNGLNLMGVSSYMQQVLKGLIIIAAVCMYERKKK
ncbi:MAG: ABC transporter permease [Eubacteriales bacterium]|nr:ABC transporter permease [Eubacteriales bacterium]